MPRSQAGEVIGVVGNDESTSKSNSRCHDQRVNRIFAPLATLGQDVPGDASNSHPSGDHSNHASAKQKVYCLVRSSSPVQFNEDR